MTSRLPAAVLVVGLAALAGGCGFNAMPSRDAWYTRHYIIMQDFERAAYKDLAEPARLEFQKLFWESRSPQAKDTFDARMKVILTQFKGENFSQPWNTDRARVFLLNGPPAGFEQRANDAWGAQDRARDTGSRSGEDISASTLEVWTYRYDQYLATYGFVFEPPNKWKQNQAGVAGSRYVGALEERNRLELFGVTDEPAYKAALEALKK